MPLRNQPARQMVVETATGALDKNLVPERVVLYKPDGEPAIIPSADEISELAIFSLRGDFSSFIGEPSNPYYIMSGTNIHRTICKLGNNGTTDTVIDFIVDDEVAFTRTILANQDLDNRVSVSGEPVSPGSILEVKVTAAGNGAERLTIQVVII